jgi:hypothetical protein
MRFTLSRKALLYLCCGKVASLMTLVVIFRPAQNLMDTTVSLARRPAEITLTWHCRMAAFVVVAIASPRAASMAMLLPMSVELSALEKLGWNPQDIAAVFSGTLCICC